jgi:hypothetical protein
MKKVLLALALTAGILVSGSLQAQSNMSEDLVRVYRWFSPVDNNFVTLADGEIQEGQLLLWKYRDKTFLFYGYKTPGADRVAVYRWTHPETKDQVSIAEDEETDGNMIQKGYTNKTLQFYAPIRRASNHVPIYRWYKKSTKDWVTFPENGDTDKYWSKRFSLKTFQYYGVLRNEYESN